MEDVHSLRSFAIFSDAVLPLIGYHFVRLNYIDDKITEKYKKHMVELQKYSTT